MPIHIDFLYYYDEYDDYDADADAVTPSSNTRSVPSSPGRSFFCFKLESFCGGRERTL